MKMVYPPAQAERLSQSEELRIESTHVILIPFPTNYLMFTEVYTLTCPSHSFNYVLGLWEITQYLLYETLNP